MESLDYGIGKEGKAMDKKDVSQKEFSGFNRFLKSESLQGIINKLNDDTFSSFRDDWKWIFSYSKRHKKAILLYLLLGILSTTLGLVSSVASKYLIDIIVGRKLDQLWVLVLMMGFSTSDQVSSLFFPTKMAFMGGSSLTERKLR